MPRRTLYVDLTIDDLSCIVREGGSVRLTGVSRSVADVCRDAMVLLCGVMEQAGHPEFLNTYCKDETETDAA